jgi:hypothetical protein
MDLAQLKEHTSVSKQSLDLSQIEFVAVPENGDEAGLIARWWLAGGN